MHTTRWALTSLVVFCFAAHAAPKKKQTDGECAYHALNGHATTATLEAPPPAKGPVIPPGFEEFLGGLNLSPESLQSIQRVIQRHTKRGEPLDLTTIELVKGLSLSQKADLFEGLSQIAADELSMYGRVIDPNKRFKRPQFTEDQMPGPRGELATWDGPKGKIKGSVLSSNDYLGLATHPHTVKMAKYALNAYGASASGSQLLNGTRAIHAELAKRTAEFVGTEDAVLFSAGYLANAGWVTGLARPGDLVLWDSKSHASLIDGIRNGENLTSHRMETLADKPAKSFMQQKFEHNDVGELKSRIEAFRAIPGNENRTIFISAEGVYSMDGDVSPAKEIVELAKKYPNVYFVLDDAHGVGVLGPGGRGVAAEAGIAGDERVLIMGTYSKSFGSRGGFIAGPRKITQLVRFYSPQHIFSAAMSPSDAAAAVGSLEVLQAQPERVTRLQGNRDFIKAQLKEKLGIEMAGDHRGAVIPIKAPGADVKTMNRKLNEAGYFVSTAEPPASPIPILRVSVSAELTHEQIEKFVDYLAKNFGNELRPKG